MNEHSFPVSQVAGDLVSLAGSESFKTERISIATVSVNSTLIEELLNVVPLVHRIVRRNLYGSHHSQVAEDVEQRVLLAIWQWRLRNPDQKLTTLEMEKIAARSAKRGALAYYRQQMRNTTDQVDFDNDSNNNRSNSEYRHSDRNIPENILVDKSVSFTGDTRAEAASLGKFLFQAIERLTLRQRYALLFQKSGLIVHLIATGACRTSDAAAALNLSRPDFLAVLGRLPFSDEQIGALWREKAGEILTAKQIREARCKARQNIKQALE